MDNYIFRRIEKDEIPRMIALIASRVHWMDEVGIRQWNTTNYLETYPVSYFEDMYSNEEILVLMDKESGGMICAAVLKSTDARWNNAHGEGWTIDEPAFYVHNFASKIGCKGSGKVFMKLAESFAFEAGKKYMRLDSAVGNKNLEDFYNELGYEAVGSCVDGLYSGILRQKKLSPQG